MTEAREYLAHSPRSERSVGPQTYCDHITKVISRTLSNVDKALHNGNEKSFIRDAVHLAAEYHDLGKLDELNQKILAKERGGALPVRHEDAGVAEMHRLGVSSKSKKIPAGLASILIYSHHRGLRNLREEQNKNGFRDRSHDPKFETTMLRTDESLARYMKVHRSVIAETKLRGEGYTIPKSLPIAHRIALSCLVDADHHDTSVHYEQAGQLQPYELKPAVRLKTLDKYIADLNSGSQSERNKLRSDVYHSCKTFNGGRGIVTCDSPVGSGKTTAVMAHLLNMAEKFGLRRIFVVLPYTNIISQSVRVYRQSISLPEEKPECLVAEHHHRAEFQSPESRHLSFQWEAPVVVTTAVQFFETLAAARTSSLRKIHQLTNSAIFIDESHAALPTALWPVSWRWLQQLTDEWNCHVVLGSGSLSRFWTLPEFSSPIQELQNIVPAKIAIESEGLESRRIAYKSNPNPLSLEELLAWISNFKGPRLVIVNTVQSAAVIARELVNNGQSVEHLSTSLCPQDRENTLQRVIERLKTPLDNEWSLIATSCVEAGVDISFETGFRERASLNSLIQTSGRVNRNGNRGICEVWDFQLIHDMLLRKHPSFDDSAAVLAELFQKSNVSASQCTEAMRMEVRREGMKKRSHELLNAETQLSFETVEELFQVIDSDTVTAVVSKSLKRRLDKGERIGFQELQLGSVQIYRNRINEFALDEFPNFRGVYRWTLAYDSFFGYMAGVLNTADLLDSGFAIC